MKETSATALDQVIIKLDTELSSDIPVIKIAVNILQSSNTIIMIQTIQVTQEVNLHQNSAKMIKETYSKCKYKQITKQEKNSCELLTRCSSGASF